MPLRSSQYMIIKWTNFHSSSTQIMVMILWMLTSICFSLYEFLLLPQKIYTVSTDLFLKYGGANVGVENCLSHFSMFVSTKVNVKLDNGNTVHYQLIGTILCLSPNCPVIYPVGTVYCCPGQPSNTILSGSLKSYFGFNKLHLNLLKIVIY